MKYLQYFLFILPLCAISYSVSALQVTIKNNLPASSPCPNGNTVSIFSPSQQVIHPGGSVKIKGDFSAMPGIGIQVNNWYWTAIKLAVQKGPPQNPDNSGGQFTINKVGAECTLQHAAAWYGKGIASYLIANITANPTATGCQVTITQNSYTNSVTPQCCAPPIDGFQNVCTGPWGAGKTWPPG